MSARSLLQIVVVPIAMKKRIGTVNTAEIAPAPHVRMLLAHVLVADRTLEKITVVLADLALLAFAHAGPPSEARL